MERHTTHGWDGAALGALRQLVARRQADDPLAPVAVVVPDRGCGLAVRRLLAREGRGVAALRVLLLTELAELVAAAQVARDGRTPLTEPLWREHVRLALADVPGALAGVAAHGATERVTARALAELRAATAAGGEQAVLAELDMAGPLPRTLAGLHRRVRARLALRHYDDHDLLLAAADVAVRPGALDEVGPVVLLAPDALPPAGQALVRALGQAGPLEILSADAHRPPESLPADHAQPLEILSPGPLPPPDALASAPDADEEVRTVVREIAGLLHAGVPAERVVVLYATPQPYATLAAAHLTSAGIPASGIAGRTLGQTVPGRVLLDLLALPEVDYARWAVLDWLGSAPLRTPGGPVPADRWAEAAEIAGVGSGREQWSRRLETLARSAAPSGPAARSLLAFLAPLLDRLDGPVDRTWNGYAAWAAELLDHCLGPGTRTGWPAEDRQAEAVLRRRLAGLAALDGPSSGAAVDAAAFRRVLRAEFEAPAVAAAGDGVRVGPLTATAAFGAEHVYVVGMAEGALPARAAEQPLLPDGVRHALRRAHPDLPSAFALLTRDERVARDRRALHAVLAGGARTTLSYPRADRRQQRERMPSPWFLELAGRVFGQERPLLADQLAPLAGGRYRAVPSVRAGVEEAGQPATAAEWVARELLVAARQGVDVLEAPLLRGDPQLARAMTVARTRASARFSAWDGHVGRHRMLDAHLGRTHAPTALGRYGTCPRQYYLATVLGIREREVRDDPLALEGARRGLLLHAILERALPAVRSGDPGTSLRRVADQVLGEAAAQGGSGTLRWRLQEDAVRTWLDRWLVEHEALGDELAVQPVGAELAFGTEDDPLGEVRVPLPGGRQLAFRGRIDRLDAGPDGDVVLVVDYKTSDSDRYRGIEKDPVLAGRELQLAVYALAAAAAYPDAEVQARYWFLGPRRTKNGRRGFTFGPDERRRTLTALDALAGGIAAGAFPARPGAWDDFEQAYEHCRSCPFDRVCPAAGERERAWERAAEAPELADYRELAEAGQ